MRRIYMLLLSGGMLLAFGIMCQAQPDASNLETIYRRQIPPGLTQKLKVQMEDHKKKVPIVMKAAEDVRGAIKMLIPRSLRL